MAGKIQGLFIDPPIAIARLGASTRPVDCFFWQDAADPHLQTVVAPTWTLDVEADGSVWPRMPDQLRFRDGNLVRPVAPFFEVWALVDAEGSSELTETPLTPALLEDNGIESLTITVDARNAKAAHRADRPELTFGTFPPVTIEWTDHRPAPLVGKSPSGLAKPMVPYDSPGIPLGRVQVMQSQKQPTDLEPWLKDVNVEVIRFRFTPAEGQFYGPVGSSDIRIIKDFAPVPLENAFLNGDAGWSGVRETPTVEPSDTFDGSEAQHPGGRSLGIVDDTCTANIEVKLVLKGAGGADGRTLSARAHVMVGPPHFAPDRRPFLSLADEIIDRSYQGRIVEHADDAWVRDLFERVYETASLLNLDHQRTQRAALLNDGELTKKMKDDEVPQPEHAMGGRDRLRVPNNPIEAASSQVPLPLTERAKQRHRNLAELDELRTLVLRDPNRLKQLVRPPFHVAANESSDRSTMQMPPFMRNSNAYPLTLAAWQYDLLLRWVAQVGPSAKKPGATFSPAAAERRLAVLTRLQTAESSRATSKPFGRTRRKP